MTDPGLPARQATAIGKGKGLTCRYEYDRAKRKFMYRFFRHGCYLGATSKPEEVVAKMTRYATAQ